MVRIECGIRSAEFGIKAVSSKDYAVGRDQRRLRVNRKELRVVCFLIAVKLTLNYFLISNNLGRTKTRHLTPET
jgi:hypothetical protein